MINNEKILIGLLFSTTFLIAFFQVSKLNLGIITSYGADVFAPMLLYYLIRRNIGSIAILFNRPVSAKQAYLIIFGACLAWEMKQYINPETGIFDFFDILAYGLSLTICYIFDTSIENLHAE